MHSFLLVKLKRISLVAAAMIVLFVMPLVGCGGGGGSSGSPSSDNPDSGSPSSDNPVGGLREGIAKKEKGEKADPKDKDKQVEKAVS